MSPLVDSRAIRAFIRSELGELSNRALISEAQDLLVEEPPPVWVEAVAFLDPSEVLDAHQILSKFLEQSSVLPDSPALRTELRREVLLRIASLDEDASKQADLVARKLYSLFRLMPGFVPLQIYLPIQEFPFPGTETADDLVTYVREHIGELVPDGRIEVEAVSRS